MPTATSTILQCPRCGDRLHPTEGKDYSCLQCGYVNYQGPYPPQVATRTVTEKQIATLRSRLGEYVTVAQAGRILQVSRRTIEGLVERGKFTVRPIQNPDQSGRYYVRGIPSSQVLARLAKRATARRLS